MKAFAFLLLLGGCWSFGRGGSGPCKPQAAGDGGGQPSRSCEVRK